MVTTMQHSALSLSLQCHLCSRETRKNRSVHRHRSCQGWDIALPEGLEPILGISLREAVQYILILAPVQEGKQEMRSLGKQGM
jgi:hypothetical protein